MRGIVHDLGPLVRKVRTTLHHPFQARFSPPGSPPGELVPSHAPTETTRIHVMSFDRETLEETEVTTAAALPESDPERTTWIDVTGLEVSVISELGKRLALHQLLVEDVVNVGQRPKVEEYDGLLFLVLDLVSLDADTLRVFKEQVSLVVEDHAVVSFREVPGSELDRVRQRIRTSKGRLRSGGTGYLAYALMDAVVDHVFPILERLGDVIEELEDAVIDGPEPEQLSELHLLKRDLLVLRRAAWPMRDTAIKLLRTESALLTDETLPFLRDVSDHMNVIVDLIEIHRERVSSLMDLYLSMVSNRMNDVMKVLTIIATIFIPLSFIAGVYGMNFDPEAGRWNMPELGWAYGYPAVLALMAAVAFGLLLFFRRKRWL